MKKMTIPPQPDPQCEYFADAAPYVPAVAINQKGLIECLTVAARKLLEYKPDQHIERPFLSHIHRRNMYRIVRDLEEMMLYGRERASWLLRLRTGRARWRWYKAEAERRSQPSEASAINVRLKML